MEPAFDTLDADWEETSPSRSIGVLEAQARLPPPPNFATDLDDHPPPTIRGWSRAEHIAQEKNINMQNVEKTLKKLSDSISGFAGAALVDYDSGMALGTLGSGLDLEIAAAGNTEVVRAKMRTMEALNLDDKIDDILITLTTQFHIIRPIGGTLFLYVALSRKTGKFGDGSASDGKCCD